MTKDPWPFPADTPVERARRIANSYRAALQSIDPEHCKHLDDRAVELGQGWVRPLESGVVDIDEALTAEQVGEIIGVAPRTIRMWGYRGHIERIDDDGKPRYRFRDVLDYLARTRQKRAGDAA